MALKPAFLIAALLLASSAMARPQIYTYVDADGMRHYTDVPDNNRYRLLVLSAQDRNFPLPRSLVNRMLLRRQS